MLQNRNNKLIIDKNCRDEEGDDKSNFPQARGGCILMQGAPICKQFEMQVPSVSCESFFPLVHPPDNLVDGTSPSRPQTMGMWLSVKTKQESKCQNEFSVMKLDPKGSEGMVYTCSR